MADDCSCNTDPLKLVREGTSQDDRVPVALDPASAPVSTRTVADGVVFAKGYARLLNRYDDHNAEVGSWEEFFGADVAVPLAIAAIEDVEAYKASIRGWFDYLNDSQNAGQHTALMDRLGYLYAAVGTLATALDDLLNSLPATVTLQGTLRNLIRSQLAPAFNRLIGYYKGRVGLGVLNAVAPSPPMLILRRVAGTFDSVLATGLSEHWVVSSGGGVGGMSWASYVGGIAANNSVYGEGGSPDPFTRINHCSTHNLFRSVFDQFLRVFMRVVSAARTSLTDVLDDFPSHPPHYALYLAFLKLLEYARTAGNTLTQKHLDFYYRTILGLQQAPAHPASVHLLADLAKQTPSYHFVPGQLFKAGKDSTKKDVFFANITDFVANKATVTGLKSIYRHGSEALTPPAQEQGRMFASPVINSDDGKGAPLTSTDQSWQPFFNKVYVDGALSQIRMPEAEIGFAVASHYLLLAEGTRTITVTIKSSVALPAMVVAGDFIGNVTGFMTTTKGWLTKPPNSFAPTDDYTLVLSLTLTGDDAAIVPYASAVHGYNFATDLPMLRVVLVQDDSQPYAYPFLQDVLIDTIDLTVDVSGLKTLAIANDFGPVDASKPFQPFSSSPNIGSSLVVGSKEVFQKQLTEASIELTWQLAPVAYSKLTIPAAYVDFLRAGTWTTSNSASMSIAPNASNPSGTNPPNATSFEMPADIGGTVSDVPNFDLNEPYSTQARRGFVRLRLNNDIGQSAYQTDLLVWLKNHTTTNPPPSADPPPPPPQVPVAAALTMAYRAFSSLDVGTTDADNFDNRAGQFFHLAPFGTAERHAHLSRGDDVPLLPQFSLSRDNATSEAEFYIGITGLVPPQNLSLLFQVVDGTANPLVSKPPSHIDWSYLAANAWVEFPENAITDSTGELLDSGMITFAIPSDATTDNTLFPSGMIWIRAAVREASDAICRLQLLAAQALKAVFSDQGNAPDFSATPLPPGSISKLANPDSAVKGITQPYPSFGGRAAERAPDFYRRISERLRHKDRAIALWDYEHLILQAFPQIYKVRCLNHTRYEPADSTGGSDICDGGIYRELAPGHVTIITLPNLRFQQQIDPLKPYTSLGLLEEIQTFLEQRATAFLDLRATGFVRLHVRNPQFEEVRVTFKVQFKAGVDESYYKTQLQQSITRFLSPWAFSGIGVPSFGGKIYKSVLINFVEEQAYVDYVTDFQLLQDIPCQPPGGQNLDVANGSRAISILVSAPASKHAISIIDAAPDQTLSETCGCDA